MVQQPLHDPRSLLPPVILSWAKVSSVREAAATVLVAQCMTLVISRNAALRFNLAAWRCFLCLGRHAFFLVRWGLGGPETQGCVDTGPLDIWPLLTEVAENWARACGLLSSDGEVTNSGSSPTMKALASDTAIGVMLRDLDEPLPRAASTLCLRCRGLRGGEIFYAYVKQLVEAEVVGKEPWLVTADGRTPTMQLSCYSS